MGSKVTAEPLPSVRTTPSPPRGLKTHHKTVIAAAVFAVVLCVLGLVYIRILPFSERTIIQDLSEASDSQVTIRGYHRTHFPSPGAVLDGVEFHKDNLLLIRIERLVIRGTYLGLLRQHVHHIKATGAHVFIPPFGTNLKFHTTHSNVVVDEIIANGAVVEFASEEEHKKPVVFDVHEGLLNNVRWGQPIQYRLKFHNPDPPGEISVSGKFGAWAEGHPQDTPLSGEYSFEKADLGVYGGIAGFLSSQGRFDGKFQHINVSGTTDIPDFEVTSGGRKVKLATHFDAYVDAMHGDTYLNKVEARFGRTTVIADGSVAGKPGQKGKFTQVQLSTRRGRIEDVLGLFVSDRSPMSGDVSIKSTAQFPSDTAPFLKKLRMDGGFGIAEGSFTKEDTQTDVDKLSAGARGQNKEDPETVMTDLKGSVQMTGGIAHFSDLSFGIPGAQSRLHGTYDLLSHKIDLHGQMQVETKISKTTTGVKSLMLKVMDPFFKKKKKGEIVPVHITGTYEKPQFGLDLSSPQQKQPAK